MPSAVLAVAVLSVEGAVFVTVGSAAMWLHGLRVEVRDLDIVPAPDRSNLNCLRHALGSIGVPISTVPPASMLAVSDVVRVTSGFGPVDLLCRRGRVAYRSLANRAGTIPVADSKVPVAALTDVLCLRRRFKDIGANE